MPGPVSGTRNKTNQAQFLPSGRNRQYASKLRTSDGAKYWE